MPEYSVGIVKRNATDLTDLLKLSGFKVFCIRNNQTYRTFAVLTQLSVVTAVCRNSMRPKTEKKIVAAGRRFSPAACWIRVFTSRSFAFSSHRSDADLYVHVSHTRCPDVTTRVT